MYMPKKIEMSVYIVMLWFNVILGLILFSFVELFWKNSSYVSGVSVYIFVALYVRMFVARAKKVEGTMRWCLRTNEILASI